MSENTNTKEGLSIANSSEMTKAGAATKSDETITLSSIAAPSVDSSVANSIPIINHTPAENKKESDKSSAFEGEDLFDAIAKLSNFSFIESIVFSDGFSRKIDCFFVDKNNLTPSGCFHYLYANDITALNITQSISSYGISANIEIVDTYGVLNAFADFNSNYYFVVSIFNMVEETKDSHRGYMVQPYIFEIEDCIIKSPDSSSKKIYSLSLKDIVSATLQKVSYGNLLLEYPGFINSNNFGEVYNTILNYAGKIINLLHGKKYKIDCSINFIEDMADSINEFLKSVIFKDLSQSMNCYDLLNYIYKHAAKEIQIPSHFTGEKPGNVLIPLFLQDEVEDIKLKYRSFFKREVSKQLTDDIIFNSGKNGTTTHATLIRRGFYCKNLLMPFNMAFNSSELDKRSIIYESINPLVDKDNNILAAEDIYFPMNGYVFSPIEDAINMPPNGQMTGLGWKNLALISDTPNGMGNMLVYFNWIYDFYLEVFLNHENSHLKKNLKKNIMPTVDPHFHVVEKANLSDADAETFAKMNANTIILKSNDPLKEALYHVGRSLKSYVMMNAMAGFKIKGDLFRRPGEIIKINSPIKNPDEDTVTSVAGGVFTIVNGFNLFYTTAITHIFNGTEFRDLIYGSRICNIFEPDDAQSVSDFKVGDSSE